MQLRKLDWHVGFHADAGAGAERWVAAEVPGAVQLDWALAEGWPDWFVADHFRQYAWMEDVYWTYRATIPPTPLDRGQRLKFVCGGVDYAFDVLLNGRTLHTQEGMFTPFELDVSDAAASGGELLVRVHPAPKSVPSPTTRVQANRSCKPAVSYGWDFHPRLVPLGIWQEAGLAVRPGGRIRSTEVTYTLSESLDHAALTLDAEFDDAANGGQCRWTVTDPAGSVVVTQNAAMDAATVRLTASIDAPQLWWPHDHGDQPLYVSRVQRLDAAGRVVDEVQRRIGLRRAQLVMHPGAWSKPDAFPKSRSTPPITLEINGRRIFAKGSNWVSPDVFPGTLTAERYRPMLSLARDAHMNLLRMWGGAPVQKEAFYDLCDELGLMVWQEFPLACNNYPDDAGYLRVLEQEARSIVRRLRPHPSVVLWCGGNELFNQWSGMTDQSHALRLLNAVCYELDRPTPFLPTSPVMGMGHGHYTFRDPGGAEAWSLFQSADCTAYTEFGMPGPASVRVLRTFVPESELFPPSPGGAWETHHAFDAWLPDSWLNLKTVEHYFGPSRTLEELIERAQLLQAEGYRGLFEEVRRQKPRASMALNWCLNEPWPTAANNSLISWPCEPKPALAAVGLACRPVLASAKAERFLWTEGDLFAAELWMLNDTRERLPPGEVRADLILDGTARPLLTWTHDAIAAEANLRGPRAQFALPALAADRFELRLKTADPAHASTYTFACRRRQGPIAREGRLNL